MQSTDLWGYIYAIHRFVEILSCNPDLWGYIYAIQQFVGIHLCNPQVCGDTFMQSTD